MDGRSAAGDGRAIAAQACWPLLALTLAFMAAFRFWTTPTFETFGVVGPLDTKLGYDVAGARSYWDLLGWKGREFYRVGFHRLDLVFPIVYGAALFCAFAALLPRLHGTARWAVAAALVLPGVLLDYAENAAVAELMRAQVFDPAAAARASLLTPAKTILVGASAVGALGLAAVAGVRRMIAGKPR